ncbi:hypothetical protein [Pelagerythrobacter sp.]|uniref:hypothetical protein n=1 Tax=Pelagerythrobacter sp. TaxID=2800702 RepID=UPI0035B06731
MSENSKQSFAAMLVGDVFASMHRRELHDSQASRRDLVRTSFAAIEGFVWIFREHIVEAADSTYGLTEEESQVLAENSYQVNDQGRINAQPKFLPMLSQVRLIARIAARIAPEAEIDFSGSDWKSMREAVRVRNRITHPKTTADLELSKGDVDRSVSAFFWFGEAASSAMEHANVAVHGYLGLFKDVLEKLKAGDPETTLLYQYIAKSGDES